jgi:hypothetical protein
MSDHDAAEGSEPPPHNPGAPADLQFDEAELATPAPSGPTCQMCKQQILDDYFEANGKIFCGACRQRIEAAFRGGSPLGRVAKATVLGTIAATVGAFLYYIVSRLTGYNIGLIAVVVGFMVGGAVRKGTGNRGGLFYQLLAVFLCYTGIGLMHLMFAQLGTGEKVPEPEPEKPAVVAQKGAPDRQAATADREPAPPKPAPQPEAAGAKVAQANEAPGAPKPMSRTKLAVLLAVVYLFMLYASPVFHAYLAPISGLIYCFALWEAWKINKAAKLSFAGPFRVSAHAPPAQGVEGAVDGE